MEEKISKQNIDRLNISDNSIKNNNYWTIMQKKQKRFEKIRYTTI